MRLIENLESLREELRSETGRWLGKAIGLVRNPHESYEEQVRELWREERIRLPTKPPGCEN